MPTNNSINVSSTGIVGFTGTAFVETAATNHAILVGGSTSSTFSNVGPTSTSGQVLQSAGASADPAYSTATYPATATGTGTILRADGTNWVASTNTYPNTATTGDILIATGSNVIGSLADAAVGQVLTSGGAGVAPAYSATPTVTSITFGAGNALSAYVTSTWTPTIVGQSVTGTTTYTVQVGLYTIIGNLICCFFKITITGATGTGNALIGGFPQTVKNTTNASFHSSFDINGTGWAWPVLTTQCNLSPIINTITANVICSGNALGTAALQMSNAAATFNGTAMFLF